MTADLLPLFPLNTVLFPGVPLPLHIFENRYRTLVEDLDAHGGPRRFGVVAIRQGLEVGEDEQPVVYDVGCVAEVRHTSRYADGRYDIVTLGGPRFRLLGVDDARPYLCGNVEYLAEDDGAGARGWVAAVVAAFREYCEAVADLLGAEIADPDLPTDDPVLVSYVVAAAMRLDLPEKQALLAVPDTASRLRTELGLLRRETALLAATPSDVPKEGPFSLN